MWVLAQDGFAPKPAQVTQHEGTQPDCADSARLVCDLHREFGRVHLVLLPRRASRSREPGGSGSGETALGSNRCSRVPGPGSPGMGAVATTPGHGNAPVQIGSLGERKLSRAGLTHRLASQGAATDTSAQASDRTDAEPFPLQVVDQNTLPQSFRPAAPISVSGERQAPLTSGEYSTARFGENAAADDTEGSAQTGRFRTCQPFGE